MIQVGTNNKQLENALSQGQKQKTQFACNITALMVDQTQKNNLFLLTILPPSYCLNNVMGKIKTWKFYSDHEALAYTNKQNSREKWVMEVSGALKAVNCYIVHYTH